MAVKEDNKRISLTLSKELDEKIDKLAGLQNISRNAVIVNLIETSIDMQIGVWETMKNPDKLQGLLDLSTKLGIVSEQNKDTLDEISEIMKEKGKTKEQKELYKKAEKEYEILKK